MPSTDDATRLLATKVGEWVLPYWLERQADPSSPDFTALPAGAPVTNVTHRERVPVGTLGSRAVATVDPRGLVTPSPGSWSLDWWVGADDRWHVPSREVAVRQSLVEDAPVVQTAMRVPGGDVVQRVWAFHDAACGDVLAVEVENATRVPVALALAVRPYGPDGAGDVRTIAVRERHVLVDGALAVWLAKVASRVAVSTWQEGDVSATVLTGAAAEGAVATATCPDGLAQAAIVIPLAHAATFRVLLPLGAAAVEGAGGGGIEPTAVPPGDAVARGWTAHSGRGTRVELPETELAATFAAARAQLLLAAAGRTLAAGDPHETAAIVRALDRCGLHDEASAIVATAPDGQGPGGRLGGRTTSGSATGAVLHAAGSHWWAGRERELAGELAGVLAAGGHHRPGSGRLARRSATPLAGSDAAWQLRGSLDVVRLLDAVEQPDAARELERRSADVVAAVDEAVARLAGPGPVPDPLELLDLVVPLELVEAGRDEVGDLLDQIRSVAVHGSAVLDRGGPVGFSPERTARLAQAEIRRGAAAALDRLTWLVEAAGPVRCWPALIHPRTGGGSAGPGWSVGAAAAFVELVTDLLAHASPSGDVTICPVVPDAWFGAGLEAHDLVTRAGRLSFAVRWHGERPALLWEMTPFEDVGAVRISAPGLDPSWSTTELRGEALLAATRPAPSAAEVAAPDAPEAADDPGPAEGDSFA